jgi:hypothetical protein
VQNGSDIYRTECFPSPLTDDVIINVLAPSTFCFYRDTEGRAYRPDSDNADLGFSYTAKSVFSLFNPTTPIKGILSVSNIICILNGIINKKIKTQTTREQYSQK